MLWALALARILARSIMLGVICALPTECKGGYFMLSFSTGNDNGLGSDFFRVDE